VRVIRLGKRSRSQAIPGENSEPRAERQGVQLVQLVMNVGEMLVLERHDEVVGAGVSQNEIGPELAAESVQADEVLVGHRRACRRVDNPDVAATGPEIALQDPGRTGPATERPSPARRSRRSGRHGIRAAF